MNLREVCTSWTLRIQTAPRAQLETASAWAVDFALKSRRRLNQTINPDVVNSFRWIIFRQ